MIAWSKEELRESLLLYAVTDGAWLGSRSLVDCVSQAIDGGVSFVQLREKNSSSAERERLACDLLQLCRRARIPFVVNDDVETARVVGADGVHVGQGDMNCMEARAILGSDAIVGVSVQTLDQALEAERQGASYLGVGAMFGTPTKLDAQVVSLDALKAICSSVSIPVVAIGGLNEETLPALTGSGVDGAAVVSAIFAADNITLASKRLRATMAEILGK